MENRCESIYMAKFPKKRTITTIVLIMLLAFSALMAGMQSLTVQATGEIQSYAFIAAEPNPVGKDQPVLVNCWVADPLPSATTGIGQFRTGYKVTITKPDTTVDTKSSLKPDYIGGAYFYYTPTMVGQYTFNFTYAGETIYYQWDNVNNKPLNPQNNFTASPASYVEVLTVQEQPVQTVFQVPYPDNYWTRPIYGQNYWWSEISSNWLMAAWNSTARAFDNNYAFVPEGKLANSGHILWTKPMTFGGLAGGLFNNIPYYSGMSYEMYYQPPIIVGGRIYYTTIEAGEPRGEGGPFSNLGTACVDLNTGETLFTIPNATMSYGQVMNFAGPNQAGTFAYLWSSSGSGASALMTLYDPWTGNKIISIGNLTSGVTTFGKNGEIIIYNLAYNTTAASYQLTLWNSTRCIESYQTTGTGTTSQDYAWRPFTTYSAALAPINGYRGIQWQVNVSAIAPSSFANYTLGSNYGSYDGENILAYQAAANRGVTNITSTIGLNITAFNMKTGAVAYQTQIAPAPDMPNALHGIAAFENIWEFNGHLYSFNHYTLQWVAYDTKTGDVMWVAPPLKNSYGYFSQAASLIEAYGLTITAGFDGWAYGYNTTTGHVEWEFYAGDSGLLTPYGHGTFYDGVTVCDGKIILLPNEHGSGVLPLYQNLTTFVLDARTGKLVWSILGYFEKPALADGILTSHNNYDNQIYAFGKGPSQTTVEAPLTAVNPGSSFIIQGSVTDQSVGAIAQAKIIGAKSIPVVSGADQSRYMEYLYMQQAYPIDAKGVPVQLTAYDSNGASQTLGQATTDLTGTFAIAWTPNTAGMYTIVATFEGSGSYWGSYSETHVVVQSAPSGSPSVPTPPTSPTETPSASPTAPTPPPGGLSATELYLIAVAIVVIIIVVAVAVILRRRK
jgi:hypothetical protein